MKEKTFMRVDGQLLRELKKIKLARGESYADVVKRLIEKDRGRLK